MSKVLNRQGLVKRFMESSGYTNLSQTCGIRKDGKGHLYDFREPETMLKDFLKWMKAQDAGKVDPTSSKTGQEHYNSKLSEFDAVAIWETQGIAGSTITARAFGVSPKAVRDIWNRVSWKETIKNHEASK